MGLVTQSHFLYFTIVVSILLVVSTDIVSFTKVESTFTIVESFVVSVVDDPEPHDDNAIVAIKVKDKIIFLILI